MVSGAVLAFCVSLSPVRAELRLVSIPLDLDAAFIRHAFTTQAYTDPDTTARVWDDGTGCNFMVLSDPRITAVDGLVHLHTHTDARVGQAVGERCLVLIDWAGQVETVKQAELEPGGTAVLFRVLDSSLNDGEVRRGASVLWDWLKGYVHPRLGAVRIDLQPALSDLRAILPLMLPGEPAVVQEIMDTVRLSALEVIDGGLRVQLDFQVTTDGDYEPLAPEPALSEEEIARFEAAWRGWDSFITFVVRHFAASSAVAEVRRELLAVLIDARYDILDILGDDTRFDEPDPVQRLFVQTWSRLSPVLRRLSPDVAGEQGLNLLSFVAAADVLHALDSFGPGIDLDISTDGLRRMARILAPEMAEDPMLYDQQVDPELRRLFDFGPPLLPPRDNFDFDPQGGWWRLMLPDVMPVVVAAGGPDEALIARLNGWVPARDELDAYLPKVRDLLSDTARSVAADSKLDPAHHEMFRLMVLAAGWQETCWRQFRLENDRIVPMTSSAGAVGIMQVVPSVWRGFYDTGGLARDIGYNAAAGTEILMHYLVDYAIARGEHEQTGGIDNLPRAAYAAYNGGPRHLRRYRESGTAERLQRLDRAFWDKYRAVADGDELAVLACYTS